MIDFLANYTVDEFITYTVALFLLLVGIIKFFDYINTRFGLFETKKTKTQNLLDSLNTKVDSLLDKSNTQEQNINILLESDMARIKGEIIREHSEHLLKGTIDYKTLDYLQRQFKCYEAEGGNSYVHNLMQDLEDLTLTD